MFKASVTINNGQATVKLSGEFKASTEHTQEINHAFRKGGIIDPDDKYPPTQKLVLISTSDRFVPNYKFRDQLIATIDVAAQGAGKETRYLGDKIVVRELAVA